MHRKKIAILTPVIPPYVGGMGRAALDEAMYLARDFDVTIVTPRYAYITIDAEERGPVRVIYIKPLFAFGNAAILPSLEKELQDFDIVYLHYPFFGTAEKFIYSLPTTHYELVIRYHMDVIGRGAWKPFFLLHTKFIMPQILKHAKKIIVSSLDYARHSNIKKIFQKYPEKFLEIPFGVDTEQFKPTEKDQRLFLKHDLKLNDQIILFVGGLDRAHYFKGLDILLEAIKKIGYTLYPIPYTLLVVGDGDLRPHYERMAESLGIAKSVRFVGKIVSDDLPKYYNLADVFVFPSVDQSEAFGLALLEAESCGKAVVASHLPGVRSLVAEGVNGFLAEPGNVASLTSALSRALVRHEELGVKSRTLVLAKFSHSTIANTLLDKFSKV